MLNNKIYLNDRTYQINNLISINRNHISRIYQSNIYLKDIYIKKNYNKNKYYLLRKQFMYKYGYINYPFYKHNIE
jgi:hypothetical protein